MFTNIPRHWVREFRTTHKLFLVSLGSGGQYLQILERNRVKDFTISFGLGAAAWLYDITVFIGNQKVTDGFFKSFRGDSYSLLTEIKSNSNGRFLQISKLYNGYVGNVIIPEEDNSWRDLAQIIGSFIGKRYVRNKVESYAQDELHALKKGSWNDTSKQSRENFQTYENRCSFRFAKKVSSLAVVVYRDSMDDSWDSIRGGFVSKLRRKVELTELVADRAILWCAHEGERRNLLRFPTISVPFCKPVRVVPWQQNEHSKDLVFEGRDIWVGVEGIPIDWWNTHVIRVIGELLGGLMDIDKETLCLSFLKFAKIRVKGPKSGFIPSMLALPRGPDTIVLGVFPLIDGSSSGASLGSAGRHAMQMDFSDKKTWESDRNRGEDISSHLQTLNISDSVTPSTPEVVIPIVDGINVAEPRPCDTHRIETLPLSENISKYNFSPRATKFGKQRLFGSNRVTAIWRRKTVVGSFLDSAKKFHSFTQLGISFYIEKTTRRSPCSLWKPDRNSRAFYVEENDYVAF